MPPGKVNTGYGEMVNIFMRSCSGNLFALISGIDYACIAGKMLGGTSYSFSYDFECCMLQVITITCERSLFNVSTPLLITSFLQ